MKDFIKYLVVIFVLGLLNPYTINDSVADDEDKILNDFLENAVKKARRNIEAKGRLETEDVLPLMLKFQYNDIAHLRKEMVTKTEFNAFKVEFNAFKQSLEYRFVVIESQISFLQWIIIFGFAFLAVLQSYVIFKKK